MTYVRLHGISFTDLPHIRGEWRDEDMSELMVTGALLKRKGERCIVVREEGKDWDSDSRPAYSVRMDGLHLGYIPLTETLMEEKLKARDGLVKVWKGEYENCTPQELRAISAKMNETGDTEGFSEWRHTTVEEAQKVYRRKDLEVENCIGARDYLYTEMERNRMIPEGWVTAVYFDKVEGRNFVEIGEICSLSVLLDFE
jgi:hypothetical protein